VQLLQSKNMRALQGARPALACWYRTSSSMLLLNPVQAFSQRAEKNLGVAAVFVVTGIDHNQALAQANCREKRLRGLWRDVFVGRGSNYK
jgi:hypothetical protein